MNTIIEKRVKPSLWEHPIPIKREEIPMLDQSDYENRLQKLWKMPQAKDLNTIIIYGDREHFSNVHYFTGYDARWEETLLLLQRDVEPCLLVGNEGIGYVKKLTLSIEVELYQNFSLMGQPNETSRKLEEILKSRIKVKSGKTGIIGFKAYEESTLSIQPFITDIPHYIVETLLQVISKNQIVNATDLMAHCEYGLKHQITAKEAILFELAGTRVSRGILHCLQNLRPGMTELEASTYCMFDGSPRNMHPNINFGDKNVSLGLNSPEEVVTLEYGMPAGAGYGLRGSLVHKCGMYIRNKDDLPKEKSHYFEAFLYPYFENVAAWYEMIKIGTSFGAIYEMVDEKLGLQKYGCTLNPGHLTHTDEWTNTPLQKGSTVAVRSGMALQCDYTVTWQEPFMSAHIEDGLIVADAQLREQINALAPVCYSRIQARREFIIETLGILLPDEVLPLSDLSCVCFPYMADTGIVLAK